MNESFKTSRKGLVLSSFFILVMSFIVVILIIAIVYIFNINIFTGVLTGSMNMQYSTDANRELYTVLSSDCPIEDSIYYDGYSVGDLISLYVSGSERVKDEIGPSLKGCISSSLSKVADVNNNGIDDVEDYHYMYLYVDYANMRYLETRRPKVTVSLEGDVIPWNPEAFPTMSSGQLPIDPYFFMPTMNDRAIIKLPLADAGTTDKGSVLVVLEEWSKDRWSTLSEEQQRSGRES